MAPKCGFERSFGQESPSTPESFFPYGVWRSRQPSTLAGDPSSSDLRFDLELNLKVLGRNLDGSGIYGGYTQRSLWDLDEDVREYRVETSYEPRVLALVDSGIVSKIWGAWPSALAIEVAYVHQSNGWENERSRSWNRVVVQADALDLALHGMLRGLSQ